MPLDNFLIKREHTLLRSVLDHSMDAIIAIDGDSTIIEFNRSAEEMFGWSRAVAVGNYLHEMIIPEQHRAGHLAGMAYLRESGIGPILGKRLELIANLRLIKAFASQAGNRRAERQAFAKWSNLKCACHSNHRHLPFWPE